jgi:hypothetical protein
MPERRIHATDETLPPLSLPPAALSRGDRSYGYEVDRQPPAIEPIEHRIRLDFMAGGPIQRSGLLERYNPWTSGPDDPDPWHSSGRSKPQGLVYAEASCRRALEQERSYYEQIDDDHGLEEAPDFLAHRLRACRDAEDPQNALEAERERRENWYRKVIPWINLYHVCKRSSYGSLIPHTESESRDVESLLEQNAFVGMVVVEDRAEPDAVAREWGLPAQVVTRERELSSCAEDVSSPPSEFGIELPAPLLVGEYASGGRYPLVPWSDALVCACPYKQDKPWRVLCKHELLAAEVAGRTDSIFLPVTRGVAVPHRARRFVSPAIASRYTPAPDP